MAISPYFLELRAEKPENIEYYLFDPVILGNYPGYGGKKRGKTGYHMVEEAKKRKRHEKYPSNTK